MNPKQVSAVDVIGPAYETTKGLLLSPFRWDRWWRVGIIAIFTGEIGGGSFNWNTGGGDWEKIIRDTRGRQGFFDAPMAQNPLAQMDHTTLALLVTTLVVGVLALVLTHVYIGSVMRFLQFDTVVRQRFRLSEGWRMWHPRGVRWFGFEVILIGISFLGFALLAAVAFAIWSATGAIADMKGHIGQVILVIFALLPFLLVFTFALAIVRVLAKDFAVPMIALEDLPVGEALQRVKGMAMGNKADYAVYIVMKVVLTIAQGIVVGIVSVVVLLVLAVPAIAIAVGAGLSVPEMFRNPWVLAGMITLFVCGIFAVMTALAILLAPLAMFFQAYVLHFLAPRYQPLWQLMHPAPPDGPAPPSRFDPPPYPIVPQT